MDLEVETTELPFLDQQVVMLGSHDWRTVAAAIGQLKEAGEDGLKAVLNGLSHTSPRVRRGCADFFDHHGDDRCIEALIQVALHDPVPNVRRNAIHSLGCQRCKACPLTGDLVPFILDRAEHDGSDPVRCEALNALRWIAADVRVAVTLHALRNRETNLKMRKSIEHILQFHDPEYRRQVVESAKMREMERKRVNPSCDET